MPLMNARTARPRRLLDGVAEVVLRRVLEEEPDVPQPLALAHLDRTGRSG